MNPVNANLKTKQKRPHKILKGWSAEQKKERQLKAIRDWRRRNIKKAKASCKKWVQKNRHKIKAGENIVFRKPFYRCAICLYQIGFSSSVISNRFKMTPVNLRVVLSHAGIKRGKLRPVKKRFQKDATINKLIIQCYRSDMRKLTLYDESRHWWKHPVRVAWHGLKISNKIYQTKLKKKLKRFKCLFCKCGISAVPEEQQKNLHKYCSRECQRKARQLAVILRLKSDINYWKHRRELAKKSYYRRRQERPEVFKKEYLRKVANPLNRIMRNHRSRILYLVRHGFMLKMQKSLLYFGCSPRTHLINAARG